MGATETAAATNGRPQGFAEMHILWISEGLSCDGDTISITAATQPAIEDVVRRIYEQGIG